MRETAIENKLTRSINKAGGIALKFVSPGNRGVPDRLILFPDGKHTFVELKRPGEAPTPLQNKWHEKLRGFGHDVRVIDSLAGVDAFVREVSG